MNAFALLVWHGWLLRSTVANHTCFTRLADELELVLPFLPHVDRCAFRSVNRRWNRLHTKDFETDISTGTNSEAAITHLTTALFLGDSSTVYWNPQQAIEHFEQSIRKAGILVKARCVYFYTVWLLQTGACANEQCVSVQKLWFCRCHEVRYCSRECRDRHWPQHNQTCRTNRSTDWPFYASLMRNFQNVCVLEMDVGFTNFIKQIDGVEDIVHTICAIHMANWRGSSVFEHHCRDANGSIYVMSTCMLADIKINKFKQYKQAILLIDRAREVDTSPDAAAALEIKRQDALRMFPLFM